MKMENTTTYFQNIKKGSIMLFLHEQIYSIIFAHRFKATNK
nr:MAG TPA: hypothetical protein [Caudoviricetes sp.]